MDNLSKDQIIEVKTLKSKMHIITASHNGVRYKLFQIIFEADGSIYVNFPYYKNSQGLASIVSMTAGKNYHESLSLTDNARATSHLVKYTHHPSGEAHFSLTGKVRIEMSKQSTPLEKLNGHLFTVSIQGMEGFSVGGGNKYNHGWNEKRSTVHFDCSRIGQNALKFVAIWTPFSEAVKNMKLSPDVSSIGPQFIFPKKDSPGMGFLLAPSESNPFDGHLLQLRVHIIPVINPKSTTLLSFIGGFDDRQKVSDITQDSTFLSLLYPVNNPEILEKMLGSIDIGS